MSTRRENTPISELIHAVKTIKPVDSKNLPKRSITPSPIPEDKKSKEIHPHNTNSIYIDPNRIKNWDFPDRPISELGDLDTLAQSMKIKQIQPCVVRSVNNSKYDYEVIAGERRWRAAKIANIKLWVVVENNLSTADALLCQAMENDKKTLSDYAIGMHYARLLDKQILKQKDLKRFGHTVLEINRFLAFSQIPLAIHDAVENWSLVSARTAAEIRSISNKGQKYINALIEIAPKIKTGNMGEKRIKQAIKKLVESDDYQQKIKAEEVKSISGRHLFTWRRDSNSNISISFPKDIRRMIDKAKVEQDLKTAIELQLNEIVENYPRG